MIQTAFTVKNWKTKLLRLPIEDSYGLEHVLQLGNFIDVLKKKNARGIEKVCQENVKTEGTLVLKIV